MAKENIWKLGITVAIVASLVSLLISKFLSGWLNLQQLYSSYTLQSGISPTIYESIVGIFQGFGFDFVSFIALAISSIVFVAVGMWLANVIGIKAKDDFGRYFAIVMLGTGLGYLIFIGIVAPSMATIIGALIYAAIIALFTALLYPWVDKLKV